MIIGRENRVFAGGESVIVSADMPVTGRIMQATATEPYLAVAVELEATILREVALQLGSIRASRPSAMQAVFANETETAVLDCVARLMRLIDRPEAIPLLRSGILRELHYWLLVGPHGLALRRLADPDSHSSRLAEAIALLRARYRTRIPVERLAAAAAMSLTAFHRHFKHMTSLTPVQYQKRLRLIEARRLMMEDAHSATSAAFEVGYESVSHFTRDYGRMFRIAPRRDVLRARDTPVHQEGL
jgi:AraC-like DNA-binding protein